MSEKKKNFIGMMAPHVREVAARTGLDPRLILAQSAVETGWGGKAPGHNYFGIKSHNREGGQNFMTTEYIRGVPVKKVQNFREYSGPQESSRDYANFILENPRYQEAMKAKTIDDQIKAIGKSGYATDPRYGRKLRAVALGIELPPEPQPEDKPVVEEQRPVEQREQAPPAEQPQPPEQEAEAVNYNQTDPRDEPVAFADGGTVDNFIPHDDPRRQDNFSNWFGYSHIVDQSGSPVTLYHGTDADVSEFDPNRIGQTDHGWYGEGHYLTASPELASGYSGYKNTKAIAGEEIHPGQNVMPVHARLENPYYWPEERRAATSRDEAKKITNELRKQGYDGVIAPNKYAEGPEAKFWEVVVFTPHQIKSATGNSGHYNMKSARIDRADGGSVDDQPLRDLNASGLYSHAAEMASQLPQAKGSPAQFKATLTNEKYGVKPVEMEGFDEAFAGQPSVTRDQLVQHFTSNMPQIERKVLGGSEELYPDSEPTKFSKYALPGGENYREVLLKMPQGSAKADAIYDRMAPFYSIPNGTSSSEFKALKAQHDALTSMFESSHYPDPNILVHTRLSDRTGPNNEKILHIEEIQSDWGQKGRKEGFADKSENWAQKYADFQKQAVADWIEKKTHDVFEQNPALFGSLDKSREMAQIAAKHYGMAGIAEDLGLSDVHENLYKKMDQFRNGVPSAPYVTNTTAWTDLALKDILNEAVNGGYDKVVWTPGAEQAKRYSLSNHVDEVQYSPGRNGTHSVEAYKGNNNVFNKPNATIKEIADTFGQEIADKIASGHGEVNFNTGYNVLSGLDLVTGGKGMKGYYDKIVPTQLSKLLKKIDPEARIGTHNIDTRSPSDKKMGLPEGQSINTVSAQSITITPKMREALKRGLPAYADGGSVDDEDGGLTAYHGSPHDFEQFDTSKIGTGEGAQAYGHGLYFAESEPVAQEYRDKLTAGTYKGDTGKVFDPFDDLEHMNVRVAAYKSIDNAIDRAKGLLEDYPNSDAIKRDLAKLMEAKAQNAQPQTGRMYEVRINAHPDHFLDWDAPLSEQSEHVQNAIKSIASSVDVDPFEHLALAASIGKHPRSQDYSPRGNDLYNDLEEIIGDKTKVSELLHQNGLKGIRYLDAGSRKDTDQPTRNYVVFNHDHVQVKRKYARGGAIAGA